MPANGPNFYSFDDTPATTSTSTTPATGPDVRYRFGFKTTMRDKDRSCTRSPARAVRDPKLNVIQPYSVDWVTYRGKRSTAGDADRARPAVAPPNIGPKTFPNYESFVTRRSAP